jgi:hypothetical protein
VVEPYLSCHLTITQAFLTAAGVAAGNAALVSATFLTIFVTMAIFYINKVHKEYKILPPAEKIKRDREDKEKMAARIEKLEAELSSLLRLRDHGLALAPLPVPVPWPVPAPVSLPPPPSPPPPSPTTRTSFGVISDFHDNPMYRGSLQGIPPTAPTPHIPAQQRLSISGTSYSQYDETAQPTYFSQQVPR